MDAPIRRVLCDPLIVDLRINDSTIATPVFAVPPNKLERHPIVVAADQVPVNRQSPSPIQPPDRGPMRSGSS